MLNGTPSCEAFQSYMMMMIRTSTSTSTGTGTASTHMTRSGSNGNLGWTYGSYGWSRMNGRHSSSSSSCTRIPTRKRLGVWWLRWLQ
jgi:hypothetical protein